MRQIGRYKIEHSLGMGGMGEVFKAIDGETGEPVAIKLIKGGLAVDEAARIRFIREARASRQLHHPYIVAVTDFGQHKGILYIVMEYLQGAPLSIFIPGPPLLSPRRKLLLLTQCAEAVGYAHACGVFHRDIKPANILVLTDKSAKVIDFGLAGLANLSNSLVRGGTPPYMPPEQFEQRDSGGTSDTWSLGITLFELLTGRLPFRSLDEIKSAPVPELPQNIPFSVDLGRILARALAKDPAQRYSTVAGFADDLRSVRQKIERARIGELRSDAAPAQAVPAAGEILTEISAQDKHATAVAPARDHLTTDPSPPVENQVVSANVVLPALGFARPVGGELETRLRRFLWAERIQKLRAARYLSFEGYTGVLAMLLLCFVVLNHLLSSTLIRIASLIAVPEHFPACKGCLLRMRRTSRWTRVCSTREEVNFGYRDCLAALKHRLWEDAAKLLSMYGTDLAAHYESRVLSPSARYHLSFFECPLCGHHAARITLDLAIERQWEEQPRFQEAYWGAVANKQPLLTRLVAAPKTYFRLLLEMTALLVSGGSNFVRSGTAVIIAGAILIVGLASLKFGRKPQSSRDREVLTRTRRRGSS